MRSNLRQIVSIGAACLCCLGSPAAGNSFRLHQIASSQDGTAWIIELEEVGGNNGQDKFFSSLELYVTNRYGITKTFVFPSNLPSANTAYKHVTIGTADLPGGYYFDPFRPDFVVPKEFHQFLPTDGGTIYLVQCSECIHGATIDQWSYDAIPTDGGLLRRSGEVGQGTVQNFVGRVSRCCGPVFMDPEDGLGIELTVVGVVEYYNFSLGHYFISGSQPDIDALDSGRIPGWRRSNGNGFSAASAPSDYPNLWYGPPKPFRSVPVCRYFIPPGSHFYSASADECDAVARQHAEFVLETRAAFYAVLPDLATGECPQSIGYLVVFVPVYRLWNYRADTNHRFTTSLAVRAEMIGKGWISEGYGPLGVAMCGTDWQ